MTWHTDDIGVSRSRQEKGVIGPILFYLILFEFDFPRNKQSTGKIEF